MAAQQQVLMTSIDKGQPGDMPFVGRPAAGTTSAQSLEPGAYTQFLFKTNEITSAALQPDGSLALKLSNNSTLLINNFRELADSVQTCGRDTIFQFLKDDVAANGTTSARIVNISPDALLLALDPNAAQDGTVVLGMPGAGQTREVIIEAGGKYHFAFDPQDTTRTVDGQNLILSFKNGGLMILRDFVPAVSGDLPPQMTLADGSVINAQDLGGVACTPEALVLNKPAMVAPDVEPAAGQPQTKIVKSQPHDTDVAKMLSNIEPAAGGGNAPVSAGRGGAGFASGIDAAGLNGLNPLGPIGPTSLLYGLPRFDANGARPVAAEPVTPPTPTPVDPTLRVQDARVYEDGSVTLNVATTAPAGVATTIKIEGIPNTWTVGANGGTYNPLTGTWTITVPAGTAFSGGPTLSPPHDSDIDISKLHVTSIATDVSDGSSSVLSGDIKVITDAVADQPTLAVQADGVQNFSADLHIQTAATDIDGSEEITAVYVTVPPGFTLNKGIIQADGSYLVDPSDLSGIKVFAPDHFSGNATITVKSVATEVRLSDSEFDFTNNTASVSQSVIIHFPHENGAPTIGDDVQSVDETYLGPIVVNRTLTSSFGSDGPGTIIPQGTSTFTSSGSKLNNLLTSGGKSITVTLDGDTYVGRTDTATIFTLKVSSTGAYTFTLLDNLDHANALDPNDVITLKFGVQITDIDGDSDTGTITINVVDDAPIAAPDQASTVDGQTVTGNVLTNDQSTENPYVSFICYGNQVLEVSPTGQTVINGTFGTLTIERDGDYTYSPTGASGYELLACLNPTDADVIGSSNNPVLSKNGITITAINPTNGSTLSDLTWVQEWFWGDKGIGIAGHGSNFASGPSEGFRIALDAPADRVTLTFGGFDLFDQAATDIMARVYTAANPNTPVTVALTNGIQGQYVGVVHYILNDVSFGNSDITKVEVFANDPNNQYTWTLLNVGTERYTTGTGTDTFTYTVTDADGDHTTSTITVHNTHTDGNTSPSVIDTPTPLTQAIDDFVNGTSAGPVPVSSSSSSASAFAFAASGQTVQDEQHNYAIVA